MPVRTVLTGAKVFDGSGRSVFDADIAIQGRRIAEIGSGLAGDRHIDLAGSSIIPGLFDAHVHVLGVEPKVADRLNEPFSFQFYNAITNLRELLACGITTVRDCAGADLGLKQALADGVIAGPRIHISITALSQTGGHMDGWTPSSMRVDPYYVPHPGRPSSIADGVTGVRRTVRQSLRSGADFIKVLATHSGSANYDRTRFSVEELDAIAAEAAAANVPIATHAYGKQAVKDAVRMGSRSIEHIAALDDEAIDMMVAAGTWLVPTVGRMLPRLRPDPATDGAREALGHQLDLNQDRRRQAELAFEWLRRAYDAGVKIAMGTDFGNTSGTNLVELVAMEEAGMAPVDVLRAATSSAAELMGVDEDLGTIAVGKVADLVVLDGNDPLNLENMRSRISAVYQEGRVVHRRQPARADATPSRGTSERVNS